MKKRNSREKKDSVDTFLRVKRYREQLVNFDKRYTRIMRLCLRFVYFFCLYNFIISFLILDTKEY